jgi:hypothetical protein
MRLYTKTLAEIAHTLDVSQTGACTACYAAEFHGTKQYAQEAVAKHRAMSREARLHAEKFLQQLDRYDQEVERAHEGVRYLQFDPGVQS